MNGQDVLRDFLGFKCTALSAPLSFMLIQLTVTWLALKPGRFGKIGVGVLTFIGLFYTLAQADDPIFLHQFQPGEFQILQFAILLINIVSAVAVLVFGIKTWRLNRILSPRQANRES